MGAFARVPASGASGSRELPERLEEVGGRAGDPDRGRGAFDGHLNRAVERRGVAAVADDGRARVVRDRDRHGRVGVDDERGHPLVGHHLVDDDPLHSRVDEGAALGEIVRGRPRRRGHEHAVGVAAGVARAVDAHLVVDPAAGAAALALDDHLVRGRRRRPVPGAGGEPRGLADVESVVPERPDLGAERGRRVGGLDRVEEPHLAEVYPDDRRVARVARDEEEGPVAADRDDEVAVAERVDRARVVARVEGRGGLSVEPDGLARVDDDVPERRRERRGALAPLSRDDTHFHGEPIPIPG